MNRVMLFGWVLLAVGLGDAGPFPRCRAPDCRRCERIIRFRRAKRLCAALLISAIFRRSSRRQRYHEYHQTAEIAEEIQPQGHPLYMSASRGTGDRISKRERGFDRRCRDGTVFAAQLLLINKLMKAIEQAE